MNLRKLLFRSLVFYRRSYMPVVLGTMLATAILVGALATGDAVRFSLEKIVRERLGKAEYALDSGERLFHAAIADDISKIIGTQTAPVLQTTGIASSAGGKQRVGQAQVLGVDARFGALADRPDVYRNIPEHEAVINRRLAERLHLKKGDEILLRIKKLDLLPRDAPLSLGSDLSIARPFKVRAVAADNELGRFSLRTEQLSPSSVFISLASLSRELGAADSANILLAAGKAGILPRLQTVQEVFKKTWTLADAGLEIKENRDQGIVEIKSKRIFLEPPIVTAAFKIDAQVQPVFTYFVNEIRKGERVTPYSFVSAPGAPIVPADMNDHEIIIDEWLADDLKAAAGDNIRLAYYVLGRMREIKEVSADFRVKAIAPMRAPYLDRDLLPAIPGLTGKINCRDWRPGIPVDLDKIRNKDEDYWEKYGGTPKAFVTLNAARKMWQNRFGNSTAIRFRITTQSQEKVDIIHSASAVSHYANPSRNRPADRGAAPPATEGTAFPAAKESIHNSFPEVSIVANRRLSSKNKPIGFRELSKEIIAKRLLNELDPTHYGFVFREAGKEGKQAVTHAVDFGRLFLGLSFFIILAALLLTGLLAVFNVEKRAEENGLLFALGFTGKAVRRFVLLENAVVIVIGGLLGSAAGVLYNLIIVAALKTVWQGAVGAAPIAVHFTSSSIVAGAAGGMACAFCAVCLVTWKQFKQPIGGLQRGLTKLPTMGIKNSRRSMALAAAGMTGVIILLLVARFASSREAFIFFFVAGSLFLASGLAMFKVLLYKMSRPARADNLTLFRIGIRNNARRPGRSITLAGLLATGLFIVFTVGVNRDMTAVDTEKNKIGTGGFALYGESALPILYDLNSSKGSRFYGLGAINKLGVRYVQLRVKDGDDASCLNLNRAAAPRLLGVDPEEIAARTSFVFAESSIQADLRNPWAILDKELPGGVIPALADRNVITWGLGKKVGDTLTYTAEDGRAFKVRLVGGLADSIFQGNIIISEKAFMRKFPSTGGYRLLLVAASAGRQDGIMKELSWIMQDLGLDMVPAQQRLQDFSRVRNTYLAIFLILGSFGLLLGGVGSGIVAWRNVQERRGEMALLKAIGFSRKSLRRMVLYEHGVLAAVGIFCGLAAAFLGSLPVLSVQHGKGIPYFTIIVLLVIVIINLFIWVWIAAYRAAKSDLLAALRND